MTADAPAAHRTSPSCMALCATPRAAKLDEVGEVLHRLREKLQRARGSAGDRECRGRLGRRTAVALPARTASVSAVDCARAREPERGHRAQAKIKMGRGAEQHKTAA